MSPIVVLRTPQRRKHVVAASTIPEMNSSSMRSGSVSAVTLGTSIQLADATVLHHAEALGSVVRAKPAELVIGAHRRTCPLPAHRKPDPALTAERTDSDRVAVCEAELSAGGQATRIAGDRER